MKELLLVLLVCIVVLAICLLLFAVKILLKKNGEFKRQCASFDPYTGERKNCFCGNNNVFTSKCKTKKHSVLEIDPDLLK